MASKDGLLARLTQWIDSRLGLSHEMLRPVPAYAINPFYWLGALAVVAFAIQAVTGMLMLLYYVPSPTAAYSSTQYIFQSVSYGRFLETVHLYTAYAMIMLAFMHMMRGYFVSVHKKPREAMWFVGMIMGFVTLGFGFTGYLLPWTVVSKSATDVGLGMIDALPQPVSSFLSFLAVGAGGDATELLRFFDLHIVVLPAILLILLVVKMYMLEVHGISEPVLGAPPSEKKSRLLPIFPDVSLYLLELAAAFGVLMLLISVVFPIGLPPQYTPQAASQYTAQPDWYFLWVYQILKLSIFEQAGLPVALSIVSLVFIVLFLLPIVDRGEQRRISGRPLFVTLGAILVAEISVLTAWGLLTPGQAIPDEQAVLVLGGIALAVAIVTLVSYRLVLGGLGKAHAPDGAASSPTLRSAAAWTSGAFVLLLGLGTLAIAAVFNSLVGLALDGADAASIESLGFSLGALALTVTGTIALIYRLDLGIGAVKRHVKFLEKGWGE
ncbi:MAG: cytochrome bc complex cytochrome b subunit [Thaumarchaeota archaeon]|nr:cytochrome bc complex cytochrome b subunit [Nitrososphaerota archaeon]